MHAFTLHDHTEAIFIRRTFVSATGEAFYLYMYLAAKVTVELPANCRGGYFGSQSDCETTITVGEGGGGRRHYIVLAVGVSRVRVWRVAASAGLSYPDSDHGYHILFNVD